jgi:GrpB-like predicted nucleotidyltransferase (UPF0157 family)
VSISLPRNTDAIVIADYDRRWPALFEEETARILDAIGRWLVDVQHVGSTAVPGLAAKPVIDIMPGIRDLADAPHCIGPLETLGYEYMPQFEDEMPFRRYFRKGEPRSHHLHMVEPGSDFWQRHILFRDYLRAHPQAARQYAQVKRRLAAQFGSDREGYTEAKSGFIQDIEERARREVAAGLQPCPDDEPRTEVRGA